MDIWGFDRGSALNGVQVQSPWLGSDGDKASWSWRDFVFNSLIFNEFNNVRKKWLYHYVLHISMLHVRIFNGSQPTFNNAHFM